jgi:predicted glycogen debranching enzyme
MNAAGTNAAGMTVGPQQCGTLEEGSTREWLLTDGLGGFAMGTVSGLRTRRYHGLLIAATPPPIGRMLGLVSLDPVLVIDGRRVPLATHEWASGAVQPTGYAHLVSFTESCGVARWEWRTADVVFERTMAMMHGRNAVAIVHRVVASPGPLDLELEPLCTWRDVHGERRADGVPRLESRPDGFVFEDGFTLRAEGFAAAGQWYYGVHHRVEADRGLNADDDVWSAGRIAVTLDAGGSHSTVAWSRRAEGAPEEVAEPPSAEAIISATRARVALLVDTHGPVGETVDARLLVAADRFIVTGRSGPTVVAGYPWFGDWSRDTMTSYEGLFLATGRSGEGAAVLHAAAASLSEGMLANTADAGGLQYNTVDAALWFVHAVDRHTTHTGDRALLQELLGSLIEVITHYRQGTRFGIRVNAADGLVTQGQDGLALTWMDARLPEGAVTPRIGKPVEINALWINALAVVIAALGAHRPDPALAADLRRLHALATDSFRRYVRTDARGLLDVLDGPQGDDASIRPNQLLAVSLPYGPLHDPVNAGRVVRACAALLTPLGLRSIHPDDPAYIGTHEGDVRARDHAYHQGTVWPWLIGPFIDACLVAGDPASRRLATVALEPLLLHLDEWGIGSVSETANGDAPHRATGCPFQAWSVAEVLRCRALLR